MDILAMSAEDWRGFERLTIVLGAVVFGVLGFLLFRFGLTTGRGKLKFKSEFFLFNLSGSGPGLFFMACGAIVLLVALFNGLSKKTDYLDGKPASEDIHMQNDSPGIELG